MKLNKMIPQIFCLFLLASVELMISSLAEAKVIYIPSPHLTTIQAGINLSQKGDTVLVAPGVYYENLNFKGKGILLTSHFILGRDTALIQQTIIDGSRPVNTSEGSVVRFVSGEDSTSIIQGFTLRNGTGSKIDEFVYGGGILCHLSAPRIIDNRIEENEAHFGGGISCFYSPLGNSEPKIISNHILKNRGVVGGGIFSQSSDPLIFGNRVEQNYSSYRGGGVFFKLCSPRLEENTIYQNSTVKYGGGGYALASSAEIINNYLRENQAELNGGGLYISTCSLIKIAGNIIESNSASSGGGLYYRFSSSLVTNNTFAYNRDKNLGGGIFCTGSSIYPLEVINNIFYSNQGGVSCEGEYLPLFSHNDFWDNAGVNFLCEVPGLGDTTWGVNLNLTPCDSFFNIFSEPLLADSNYNLLCFSPCIDAGDTIFSITDEVRDDIGAREYIYLSGDANGDGGKDIADAVFLINYLFKEGASPCPLRSGDPNSDGKITISDVTVLLGFLFQL